MPQSQANTPQSFIGHLRCQEATAALLHLQGLEEDEEFLRVPTLYRHTEASQKLGPGVHDPAPPPQMPLRQGVCGSGGFELPRTLTATAQQGFGLALQFGLMRQLNSSGTLAPNL